MMMLCNIYTFFVVCVFLSTASSSPLFSCGRSWVYNKLGSSWGGEFSEKCRSSSVSIARGRHRDIHTANNEDDNYVYDTSHYTSNPTYDDKVYDTSKDTSLQIALTKKSSKQRHPLRYINNRVNNNTNKHNPTPDTNKVQNTLPDTTTTTTTTIKNKNKNKSTTSLLNLPPASAYTRPLVFVEAMLCGAVSRSTAQTLMHPANTMKTILQVSNNNNDDADDDDDDDDDNDGG